MIAAELNTRLSQLLGREIDVATADKNITKMLNDHIKMYRDEVVATRASAPNIASESKDIKPSLENLEKQLEEVVAELNAIEDAEKGLKTGYVVEQPINRTLDYSLIGKYTDDDINSAARITSGGEFYVNTTAAGGKFYVVSDLTANNGLRVDVPASFTASAIALRICSLKANSPVIGLVTALTRAMVSIKISGGIFDGIGRPPVGGCSAAPMPGVIP